MRCCSGYSSMHAPAFGVEERRLHHLRQSLVAEVVHPHALADALRTAREQRERDRVSERWAQATRGHTAIDRCRRRMRRDVRAYVQRSSAIHRLESDELEALRVAGGRARERASSDECRRLALDAAREADVAGERGAVGVAADMEI